MAKWVWERTDWAERLVWDAAAVLRVHGQARLVQGRLQAKAAGLGLDDGRGLQASALVAEAIQTSAIEGEVLDPAAVRSSVARRLGVPNAGLVRPDRRTDALVEVLVDATSSHARPLTAQRLWGWQAALFPDGRSGLREVEVGRWRRSRAPMQVVSGQIGREHVHFEAPPSRVVPREMQRFLRWWNAPPEDLDGLVRAGLAHFWFVTVHPFDDGNGRIARALADRALAQDERSVQRLYSVSQRIADERDDYYRTLERCQRGTGDVTEWIAWFLGALERAMAHAIAEVDRVGAKTGFWQRHAAASLNERQRKVLGRMLDAGPGGFEGGLNTRKYVALTGTSRATAQREIAELVAAGMLRQRPGGGRSTSYDVAW